MLEKEFTFLSEDSVRLDVFVAEQISSTRSYAANLIRNSFVTKNDTVLSKNYRLKSGDKIKVALPLQTEFQIQPEDIPLEIVYEDSDVLVVNKPKGMVVHPAAGNESGTLVNALMYHCKDSLSKINGEIRPGIVHRIDKNTSGLLMVAKNDEAHVFLAEQIKEHSFTREYEAVVYGNVKSDKGVIDAPIGRHPVKRKQMTVTQSNSKNAVTHYTVLNRGRGFTHVRLNLETGRTHQIRVHMSYIGHPVAGDDVYGPKKIIKKLNGQCLHAKKIGFIHPKTREYMEFDSELPDYFKDFLKENFD